MIQYVVAIGFLAVGFTFMAMMLHFAQYKKKQSSCCGDALESYEKKENCETCPNKESSCEVPA